MSDNPTKDMLESAYIKLPGPWLDEPMTPEESDQITAFSEKLYEIKSRGPFERFTETGDLSQEYGQAIFDLSPYLNAVSHLLYLMAKDEVFKLNLSQKVVVDPIAGVYSFLDNAFSFGTDEGQVEGQLSIIEPETDISTKAGFLDFFKDPKRLRPIFQTPQTLALGKINDNYTKKRADGMGITTRRFSDPEVTITYKGKMDYPTERLLDALTMRLTDQNYYGVSKRFCDTLVEIPFKGYLESCGKSTSPANMKKQAQIIRKQLATLGDAKYKFKEARSDTTLTIKIGGGTDGVGVSADKIVFRFNPDYVSFLTPKYISYYSMLLFQISEKQPAPYYIGKKMLNHHFMDRNVSRGTNVILSVKKLLEYASDTIPTFEEVQRTDRGHWKNRIKKPFEDAMKTLETIGILKDWGYCKRGKAEATEEEKNTSDYNTFIRLYVLFHVKQPAPDQHKRLERKKAEIAAATEKKAEKKPV